MAGRITIHDYITPIRQIIDGRLPDRDEALQRLIHRARKINNRHLYRHPVRQTVKRLLEPGWRERVKRFDVDDWLKTTAFVSSRAAGILGPVPSPELVLYPGLGRFNGRVYLVDRRPVIGCSPDFPHTTGPNLTVLLAHEYAHFIRWRRIGARCDDVPIHALLFEEGWAVWLSTRMLPEVDRSRLFMSNLHRSIGMPDPPGGYFRWCERNLTTVARACRRVLRSKKPDDLGRFFQCQRFDGETTPIRTGYYLGFKLIEMLSERMTARQIFQARPNAKQVSIWLDELVERMEP